MTIVWVIYDIVEDKIRNSVVRSCKNKGLYRIQKSVFAGTLDQNQIDSLIIECEELIDPTVDSVFIFPMHKDSFDEIKLLGLTFNKDLISDQVKTYLV